MSNLTTLTVIAALIGSSLISGVFFAFSRFIMKALARRPALEGIAAMKSINVVVINPIFLGLFMGTTVICLIISIIAIAEWQMPAASYFLVGSLFYIVGTFLVTGLGNVPLNNQLAAVKEHDLDAVEVWHNYLKKWTRLNTIRSVCAMMATLIMLVGILK